MLTVAALYRFAHVADPARLREDLLELCAPAGIRGSLLVAPEGVNGTVSGGREAIDRLHAFLAGPASMQGLEWKESAAETHPFGRLKIRLKREIVTMGQPDVDPGRVVGEYVEPEDWNALVQAPDVVLIDTRNDYEVEIGTFRGAINPGTRRFRDFPAWWDRHHNVLAGRPVAMFCTGGIRCEKATSLLKARGVERVFHLHGGILRYLERIDPSESLWQGECFVFDERVSLGHGLRPGGLGLCRACRRPLTAGDRLKPGYEEGVSCHRCIDEYSDADRARFRERQRQFDLARRREGEPRRRPGA
ncbi:MAG: rhodanese-related sulfurtransferase [Alphaproteobacteria bacterium]|nr:MAG: rhodanese-related sulfurtransferase [Alphaproteobacteria bacterium]